MEPYIWGAIMMANLSIMSAAISSEGPRSQYRRRTGPSPWRLKKAMQKSSALLMLPSDILHLAFKELSGHNLLILSHTCVRLRYLIKDRFKLSYRTVLANSAEKYQFLQCMLKADVHRWACGTCSKHHAVSYSDYPHCSEQADSIRNFVRGRDRRQPRICSCRGVKHTRPCYRQEIMDFQMDLRESHVQLALKYTRLCHLLDDAGRLYLHNLLAPHFCEAYYGKPGTHASITTVHYTILSRVVDGRYIVFKERQWSDAGDDGPGGLHPTRFGRCECLWSQKKTWLDAVDARQDSVNSDSEVRIAASCANCRVEYAMRGTPDTCIVRTWQDFGTEHGEPRRFGSREDFDGGRKPQSTGERIRALFESINRL